MNKKTNQHIKKKLTGEAFDALSPKEKEKMFRALASASTEQLLARSKPLTKKQRDEWNEWKRQRGGRPQVGKGTRVIALSVERELLKQADAYAKANGIRRSELVAMGLRTVIGIAS